VSRRLRTTAAASTALVLGLGASVLVASPAAALSDDVVTPDWEWSGVEDYALQIDDAYAFYPSFHGASDIYGWAGDAFDGYLNTFQLTYAAGFPISIGLTPVSANYVDNGLTTIVSEGSVDLGQEIVVDITVTLKIQGAYAQWHFDLDDGGAGILTDVTVLANGNLGSDSETDYTAVGTNGRISTDGHLGSDPVIGTLFNTAAQFVFTGDDGNGQGGVAFQGSSDATYTLVLQDYDPCNFDEAVAAVTALVPTLETTFGGTTEPLYSDNCLMPAQSNSIESGLPANLAIPLTGSPELLAWWGAPFLDEDRFVGSVFTGLPAGVTGSIAMNPVTGVSEIRLAGTPTQLGVFQVNVVGYFVNEIDQDPLLMSFPLTVALPATGPADIAPAGLVALALLGLGAAVVFVTARARRAIG
jgi:hypothetical protein